MDDLKLRVRIVDVMHDLGIPTSLSGYNYLCEAVLRVIKNSSLTRNMIKGLYWDVATSFNTTVSRTERAIRHAIEVGCDRGNPETLQKYFGYTIGHNKDKPCNSEFIATVAEWIRLDRDL